jgi:hypothetical protein
MGLVVSFIAYLNDRTKIQFGLFFGRSFFRCSSVATGVTSVSAIVVPSVVAVASTVAVASFVAVATSAVGVVCAAGHSLRQAVFLGIPAGGVPAGAPSGGAAISEEPEAALAELPLAPDEQAPRITARITIKENNINLLWFFMIFFQSFISNYSCFQDVIQNTDNSTFISFYAFRTSVYRMKSFTEKKGPNFTPTFNRKRYPI